MMSDAIANKLRYDAVIFDFFGTLVDFLEEDELIKSHSAVAEVLNLPLGDFRRRLMATNVGRDKGAFGGVEGDLAEVHRLATGNEPSPTLIENAVEVRLKRYLRNLRPREGAIETLRQIREKGCKIGLVSDCTSELPRLWDSTEFSGLIEKPVFSCHFSIKKPDPSLYLAACANLGVEAHRCLFVGDGGSNELTGARNVGMHPVLINVGYDSHINIHRPDAENWDGRVITKLSEIPAILDFSLQIKD